MSDKGSSQGDGLKEEHFDEEKNELTEQDMFDMKTNLSVRGSHSIVSLADSSSNFGEHVGDEVQMDEVEEVDAEKLHDEINQARIYGGYMFERERNEILDGDLPETVRVLDFPLELVESSFGGRGLPREAIDAFMTNKVYLVGTAHFSKQSQEDVKKTIELVQPDVVMVELCPSRISILSLDEETLFKEAREMSTAKMMQLMKSGGPLHGVMYTLLISMSAHVTRELGMAPGGEFRCAYRTNATIPYSQFVLGDRPIEVTIGRALRSLSLWQKMKFFYHLATSHSMKITAEDVEKCKEKDVLEQLLAEMADEFPQLAEIFVTERDKYMAHALQTLLIQHAHRKFQAWAHTDVKWQPLKVVGVVGIGHAPGIVSHWGEKIDVQPLLFLRPPTWQENATRFAFKWSFYGLAAYGLFRAGRAIFRRVGRV